MKSMNVFQNWKGDICVNCEEAVKRIQEKFSTKEELVEFYDEVMKMSEEEKQKFSNCHYSCVLNMLMDSLKMI